MVDFSKAKELINSNEPTFLEVANDKNSYVCPSCQNGTGETGNGLSRWKANGSYKCFKCGLNEDIIGLIGLYFGLTEYKDQISKGIELYGIDVNNMDYEPINNISSHNKPSEQKEYDEVEKMDFKEFYSKALSNANYEYLEKRGISSNTQKLYCIGFCSDWVNPNPDTRYKTPEPKIIIPITNYSYCARSVKDNDKYKSLYTGRKDLYMRGNVFDSKYIFVCEGEIDWLSVAELGFSCIGVPGITSKSLLTKKLKEIEPGRLPHIIVLFDDDEPGANATKSLLKDLTEIGVKCCDGMQNLLKSAKMEGTEYSGLDINDLLLQDRESLKSGLQNILDNLNVAEDIENLDKSKSIKQCNYNKIGHFRKIIEGTAEPFTQISTGFEELDKHLQGGLHNWLYMLQGTSGFGKTTFLLQIADNIAKNGNDVIFISLEMSQEDLMSKSLSRLCFLNNAEGGRYGLDGYENNTMTPDAIEIMNSMNYSNYSQNKINLISKALDIYENEISDNIYVYERYIEQNGQMTPEVMTVHRIEEIISNHISKTGRKPVVMIDYFQLLSLPEGVLSETQGQDINISHLVALTRTYDIPILCISSMSKDAQKTELNINSGKGTANIGYSADVVLSLKLAVEKGINEKNSEFETRKSKELKDNEDRKYKKQFCNVLLKCEKIRLGYEFRQKLHLLHAFNYYAEGFTNTISKSKSTESVPFENDDIPTI